MSTTPSKKERVHNFNAGPAILPIEALDELREGFMNFGGMSVLEISHRGKEFKAVLEETVSLVRELMGVPEGWHVLFMQGGASQQFAMVPMNLMDKGADYANTGTWAKKAIAEAKFFGTPATVYSSQETKFDRCPRPEEVKTTPGASYLHVTSNNTIEGTQYRAFPDSGDVPLIADMSSDILSCPVDVSKFGMISRTIDTSSAFSRSSPESDETTGGCLRNDRVLANASSRARLCGDRSSSRVA